MYEVHQVTDTYRGTQGRHTVGEQNLTSSPRDSVSQNSPHSANVQCDLTILSPLVTVRQSQ